MLKWCNFCKLTTKKKTYTETLMKRFILILLSMFLACPVSQAQVLRQYLKLSKNIEKYYRMGDYKRAQALTEKKLKKAKSELQRGWLQALQARNQEALAHFEQMQQNIEASQQILSKTSQQGDAFALGYLVLTQTWLEYGNLNQAQQVLTSIDTSHIQNPLIKSLYKEYRANLLLQSQEALAAYELAQETVRSRLEQLKSKQQKLSGTEKRFVKRQLARDLTLMARAQTVYGNYEAADSLLTIHNSTVRRLVGVTDPDYAAHLIAFGENYDAQEQYPKATYYYKMAQRAQLYYDFAFKESSKTYLRLLEGIARNSVKRRQLRFVQNANIREMKRVAGQYYGKQSPYYFRAQIIEMERAIRERRFKEAENILNGIVQDEKLPKDHPIYADLLRVWTDLYVQNDVSIQKAEGLNQLYLKAQQQRLIPETFAYKRALLDYAAFHVNYGEDFLKAKTVFEKELPIELFEEKMYFGHYLSPDYHRLYAEFFLLNDQYARAKSIMQQTVEQLNRRYGERHIKVARAKLLFAEILQENGEFKQASNEAEDALQIVEKNSEPESVDYALALMQIAKIYAAISDYNQATQLLSQANATIATIEQKAAKKQKKQGIPTDYTALKASSIEELAEVYARIGEFESTLQLLSDILDKKQNKYGSGSRRLIRPHQATASVLILQGNYTDAQKHVYEALDIAEKSYGKQSIKYADVLTQQVKMHIDLGDIEKAEAEVDLIRRIQKEKLGKLHIKMADILSEAALIEYSLHPERSQETEALLQEGIALAESTFGKQHPTYAQLITALATLYKEERRYTDAVRLLKQAEEIYSNKFGAKHHQVAYVKSLLGEVSLRESAYNDARGYFQQAKDIYAATFGEQHPAYTQQVTYLARLAYIKGQVDSAALLYQQSLDAYLLFIEKYFPSLSEREKAKYWASIQPHFQLFKSLASSRPADSPLHPVLLNYTLTTKALLLNAGQKTRQQLTQNKDSVLVDLYSQWVRKKEQLAALLNLSKEEQARLGISPLALESDINRLEKKLSERAAIFEKLKIERVNWQQVQKQLRGDEAAIEILKVEHFSTEQNAFTDSVYYVAYLILPAANQPIPIILSQGKAMESKYYNYYCNATRFKLRDRFSYEQFWQTIEARLPAGVKRVYISPDGVYNQINIAALYRPSTQDYVFDGYDIRYLSNSKELLKRGVPSNTTPANKQGEVLIVGNPDFGGEVPPLPGAELEARLIAQLLKQFNWQILTLMGIEATEQQIKNLRQSPNILHFATHGFFAEGSSSKATQRSFENLLANDPMLRSGLLLKDGGRLLSEGAAAINTGEGILTAYEAQNLPLDNTRLVVLSACETGLGDVQAGEGVYGLQRAFLVAGARSVIMSLFKVNDEATQKLMNYFYEAYLQTNDAHAAFRQAQQRMRKEYPHPYFWGSFIITGME
jgi:CHAT domain-containing protein